MFNGRIIFRNLLFSLIFAIFIAILLIAVKLFFPTLVDASIGPFIAATLTVFAGFFGILCKDTFDLDLNTRQRNLQFKKEVYIEACEAFSKSVGFLQLAADPQIPVSRPDVSSAILKLHLISSTVLIETLTDFSHAYSFAALKILTKRLSLDLKIQERDGCLKTHSICLDHHKELTDKIRDPYYATILNDIREQQDQLQKEMKELIERHEILNKEVLDETLSIAREAFDETQNLHPKLAKCLIGMREELEVAFTKEEEEKYFAMIGASAERNKKVLEGFFSDMMAQAQKIQ